METDGAAVGAAMDVTGSGEGITDRSETPAVPPPPTSTPTPEHALQLQQQLSQQPQQTQTQALMQQQGSTDMEIEGTEQQQAASTSATAATATAATAATAAGLMTSPVKRISAPAADCTPACPTVFLFLLLELNIVFVLLSCFIGL